MTKLNLNIHKKRRYKPSTFEFIRLKSMLDTIAAIQ